MHVIMSFYDSTSPRHMNRLTFGRLAWAVVLPCLLAGCGGAEYEVVPVSGRVTLDGKPLADVGLMFVPLSEGRDNPNIGPGSLGRTDADGRFALQTVRGEDGAVTAKHIVRMSMASDGGAEEGSDEFTPEGDVKRKPTATKSKLPQHAVDGSLTFDVPAAGTDQANFHLVSQ